MDPLKHGIVLYALSYYELIDHLTDPISCDPISPNSPIGEITNRIFEMKVVNNE